MILIISTYTEGAPPDTAAWFYKWLEESAKDFRVGNSFLKGLKYSVFGLGHSLYSDDFNTVGKNCDKFLHQLSGQRLMPVCLGDENVSNNKNGSIEEDFNVWKKKLLQTILDKEAPENDVISTDESEDESEENDSGDDLVDLEDLGKVMKKAKDSKSGPKEMLTSSLRQSLTKQGYKLIGSHSGVKICRWTKAMLRGRGGCYKHTFYGIESHR